MLVPILMAAFLFPAHQVSLECANVPDVAAAQTQPAGGPDGMVVVLKVSSADDHSKNSHMCNAEYQLLVTHATGAPKVVKLFSSDDDWGRRLSIRLNGFSHDGKRVCGIISEGGKYLFTTVFDYDTTNDTVQLIELPKRLERMAAKCSTIFDVVGTAETGVILELNSAKPCASDGRWLLNPGKFFDPAQNTWTTGKMHRLSQGAAIQTLYNMEVR